MPSAERYCGRCTAAHGTTETMRYANLYGYVCADDNGCDDRLMDWLHIPGPVAGFWLHNMNSR